MKIADVRKGAIVVPRGIGLEVEVLGFSAGQAFVRPVRVESRVLDLPDGETVDFRLRARPFYVDGDLEVEVQR